MDAWIFPLLSVVGGMVSTLVGGLVVIWKAGRVWGVVSQKVEEHSATLERHEARLERHEARLESVEATVNRHEGLMSAGRVP